MNKMKKVMQLVLIIIITALATSCSAQTKEEPNVDWEASSAYELNGVKAYGKQNRLLFVPQGDSDISSGGHFFIYFWGKEDEIASTYSLIGVHKDTGVKQELYSNWEVSTGNNVLGADASSGAKFSLNQKGLWRLEIYMGEQYFDSIVVEAK